MFLAMAESGVMGEKAQVLCSRDTPQAEKQQPQKERRN